MRLFAAGPILGCIPTLRYPEAIYAPAIAVFILLCGRERKAWFTLIAGAILPVLPVLVRNHYAFACCSSWMNERTFQIVAAFRCLHRRKAPTLRP